MSDKIKKRLEGFKVVKNKGVVKPKIYKELELPMQNRFSILQEEDKTYLIGDTTIRNQIDHFDTWDTIKRNFAASRAAKLRK